MTNDCNIFPSVILYFSELWREMLSYVFAPCCALVLLLLHSLPSLEPGFNSWFLSSVTTCPVLENILQEFTHKHQGYGCSSYFKDIQLSKFSNSPLALFFQEGDKVQKLRGRSHIKWDEGESQRCGNVKKTVSDLPLGPLLTKIGYKANSDHVQVSAVPRFSTVRGRQQY